MAIFQHSLAIVVIEGVSYFEAHFTWSKKEKMVIDDSVNYAGQQDWSKYLPRQTQSYTKSGSSDH